MNTDAIRPDIFGWFTSANGKPEHDRRIGQRADVSACRGCATELYGDSLVRGRVLGARLEDGQHTAVKACLTIE